MVWIGSTYRIAGREENNPTLYSLSVSPNPATSEINLMGLSPEFRNGNIFYKIISLDGQTKFQGNLNGKNLKISITTQSLSNGSYILLLCNETGLSEHVRLTVVR